MPVSDPQSHCIFANCEQILFSLHVYCRCTAFPAFLLFTCLYGLLTGAWIAATTPLLLSILNLHLLTPAVGLMTAVQVGTRGPKKMENTGGGGPSHSSGLSGISYRKSSRIGIVSRHLLYLTLWPQSHTVHISWEYHMDHNHTHSLSSLRRFSSLVSIILTTIIPTASPVSVCPLLDHHMNYNHTHSLSILRMTSLRILI